MCMAIGILCLALIDVAEDSTPDLGGRVLLISIMGSVSVRNTCFS